MAESLGGERPGVRKEERFRGVGRPGGERVSGAAGSGDLGDCGSSRGGGRGSGGAAATRSSSPVPSPRRRRCSAGAGRGYVEPGRAGPGRTRSRSGSGRSAPRRPLPLPAGTLWPRRRCGGRQRCACGAPGRRGERPRSCPVPLGVALKRRARSEASEGSGRAGRGGGPARLRPSLRALGADPGLGRPSPTRFPKQVGRLGT